MAGEPSVLAVDETVTNGLEIVTLTTAAMMPPQFSVGIASVTAGGSHSVEPDAIVTTASLLMDKGRDGYVQRSGRAGCMVKPSLVDAAL